MQDVPSTVNPTRLGLIQLGHLLIRIKANDQRTNPKWPHTTSRRIPLLHTGNIFRNILDRDGILYREPMTLCLQPRLVDQDSCICIQASESETHVCVHEGDFGGGDAGVLEFHCGALFAAEDYDVCAFDADGAGAAFYCFEGVFDLEDVAIGGEDWGLLLLVQGWWWCAEWIALQRMLPEIALS